MNKNIIPRLNYLKPINNKKVIMKSFRVHSNRDCSKCFFFHSKDFLNLAEKIKSQNECIQLGKIKWNKFNDGYPNIFIEDAEELRNSHVAFLASFQNSSDIFEQFSVIYSLPKLFLKSFTLILPYFPTGTHERMEEEGDVATASTMARMISNIPPTRSGPTNVVIYDIHALQERFFFGDNVLPLFSSGIPLLLEKLDKLEEKVSIVYPDSGSWKRFHKMFSNYPEIICTKVRDGDKRIVQIKEGEVKNKHVVIVDDLVQSGGTLVECYNVLQKAGASKVSMYATHAVFPKNNWEKFQKIDIENFWITDSCPLTINDIRISSYQKVKPFEVLSLADSITETLLYDIN